jgi:hypothetical protein
MFSLPRASASLLVVRSRCSYTRSFKSVYLFPIPSPSKSHVVTGATDAFLQLSQSLLSIGLTGEEDASKGASDSIHSPVHSHQRTLLVLT